MINVKKFALSCLMLLGVSVLATAPLHASVPSAGATIQDRSVPKDGNGALWQESMTTLGYKLFVATASSAIQLVDTNGVAPTCGIVHAAWVSSGTATSDFAVLYDSAPTVAGTLLAAGGVGFLQNLTVANQSANRVSALSPLMNRAAALPTNYLLDVQFNYGVVVLQSSAPSDGTTHVLWRPCKGLAN